MATRNLINEMNSTVLRKSDDGSAEGHQATRLLLGLAAVFIITVILHRLRRYRRNRRSNNNENNRGNVNNRRIFMNHYTSDGSNSINNIRMTARTPFYFHGGRIASVISSGGRYHYHRNYRNFYGDVEGITVEELDNVAPVKIYNGKNKVKDNDNEKGEGEEEEDVAVCAICLDEIKEGRKVRELKCGHVYHSTCIAKWVVKKNSCPHCTRKVVGFSTDSNNEENNQEQVSGQERVGGANEGRGVVVSLNEDLR